MSHFDAFSCDGRTLLANESLEMFSVKENDELWILGELFGVFPGIYSKLQLEISKKKEEGQLWEAPQITPQDAE